MDIFLIVVTLIIFALLFVIGAYLLVHFTHRDDKNDSYFPKFVVLTGFVLCGSVVLLLPLDVANNDGYAGCDGYDTKLCGGLNMELFWNIIYVMVLVWIVVMIPFSTFFYEADDGMLMSGTAAGKKESANSRLVEAIKYEIIVLVVAGLLFLLTYFFLKETNIPVREYTGPSLSEVQQYETNEMFDVTNETVSLPFSRNHLMNMSPKDTEAYKLVQTGQYNTITIDVGIVTYFTAILAFLGWIFFSVFGGIGMAALPLDLILIFKNRPRHMDAVEMADAQTGIKARVNELVDIGEMIKIERDEKTMQSNTNTSEKKGFFGFLSGGSNSNSGRQMTRKEKKEAKQTLLKFKQAVYILETDVEDFKASTTSYNEYNPLIPYASLLFGLLSIIISILWVLQIAVYVLPETPIHPLLNSYFQWFDNWFPLFGVLSVALFSFYLLICAVKGCFKFGLRFFFFTIHPMRPNRTYMSSFLFNIGLLLLCSVPVVQFSTYAFASYARNTTALQVFGTQIRYLKFFSFFFVNHVFIYAFLAFFGMTCLYLAFKPRDQATDSTVLRERLKSRRS